MRTILVDDLTWKCLKGIQAHLATSDVWDKTSAREEKDRVARMDEAEFLEWGLLQFYKSYVASERPSRGSTAPVTDWAAKALVRQLCDKCFLKPGAVNVAGKHLCADCLKKRFGGD